MKPKDDIQMMIGTLNEMWDYLSTIQRKMLDGASVIPFILNKPRNMDEQMTKLIIEQLKSGNLFPEA